MLLIEMIIRRAIHALRRLIIKTNRLAGQESIKCRSLSSASSLRIVKGGAFGLPPSNHTASGERPLLRRDYRALFFALSAVVVEYYPILGLSQFVRQRRVGEESRVAPFAALRMQHRQPRPAGRVESLGGDLPEPARLRLLSIFVINIEEFADGRRIRRLRYRPSAAAEAGGQRFLDSGDPFLAEAGDLRQTSVMSRRLKLFQRRDSQLGMKAFSQTRADSRNRSQRGYRIPFTSQALERR